MPQYIQLTLNVLREVRGLLQRLFKWQAKALIFTL
jgi:hypothetical protein